MTKRQNNYSRGLNKLTFFQSTVLLSLALANLVLVGVAIALLVAILLKSNAESAAGEFEKSKLLN